MSEESGCERSGRNDGLEPELMVETPEGCFLMIREGKDDGELLIRRTSGTTGALWVV